MDEKNLYIANPDQLAKMVKAVNGNGNGKLSIIQIALNVLMTLALLFSSFALLQFKQFSDKLEKIESRQWTINGEQQALKGRVDNNEQNFKSILGALSTTKKAYAKEYDGD